MKLLSLLAILPWLLACQNSDEKASEASQASANPSPSKLPTVKDDTKNLLLTWIDEKGEFHTTQKVSDVPEAHRKKVRAVVTTQPAAAGDMLFVADLTKKNSDGSYAVSTMERSKWDELGAKLRKTRLEALAPSTAPPASAAPGDDKKAAAAKPANAALGVSAIVYGASWCKPCHAAEAYLKKRGVSVVMKDIEESDQARSEMQKKLARAGMGGAQIPIIDVMGQLLVGYSPAALDRAISSVRKQTL